MIHEIAPRRFVGEFRLVEPKLSDIVLCFQEQQVLLIERNGELRLPILKEMECASINKEQLYYLFSIDDQAIFLYQRVMKEFGALRYYGISVFRELTYPHEAFALVTGGQLYRWKRNNCYCGRCQTKMEDSKTERAVVCPKCNNTVYPKISPAIIVAIRKGDDLLLTKYANRPYKRYSLVAGFVEIGESFEEAVRREVMEEVGLRIKNIRYYKSSPWGVSDTMMVGFFAELDGDDHITLQESELSEARWFPKDEIPEYPSVISIGEEMIELIRNS